jgi:hypothetical protein
VFDAPTRCDGVLTRQEAIGTGDGPQDEFHSVDGQRRRRHAQRVALESRRLDGSDAPRRPTTAGMGQRAATVLPAQTQAYRAGYERGHPDGVQAGHEDKPRGWDPTAAR